MMLEGKIIEISKDVIITANTQIQFDRYLMKRFGLKKVATIGYTCYYRVEESRGNFVWNHSMMNLHLGHEVDVETRYDLKIEINPKNVEFMILKSSIEHPKCNNEYLLDVWNKIMDKVINK